jgi:hypothetical protein
MNLTGLSASEGLTLAVDSLVSILRMITKASIHRGKRNSHVNPNNRNDTFHCDMHYATYWLRSCTQCGTLV